jgi:hypothetical protein
MGLSLVDLRRHVLRGSSKHQRRSEALLFGQTKVGDIEG